MSVECVLFFFPIHCLFYPPSCCSHYVVDRLFLFLVIPFPCYFFSLSILTGSLVFAGQVNQVCCDVCCRTILDKMWRHDVRDVLGQDDDDDDIRHGWWWAIGRLVDYFESLTSTWTSLPCWQWCFWENEWWQRRANIDSDRRTRVVVSARLPHDTPRLRSSRHWKLAGTRPAATSMRIVELFTLNSGWSDGFNRSDRGTVDAGSADVVVVVVVGWIYDKAPAIGLKSGRATYWPIETNIFIVFLFLFRSNNIP